ncbi:MAG TPA: methylated-DNA--[protein]-cysteine S-methyltransferase [Solirubrobacterales bacterium]|nr:methylated-DNA--[protein]-cysteine S-methyltransferase [Solirubrobacterales bacterium]
MSAQHGDIGIARIKDVLRGDGEDRAAAAAARVAELAEREQLLDVAYASYDSPLGTGYVAATERGIVAVALPNRDPDEFLEKLADGISPRVLELPARLDQARRELDQYFAGSRRRFELDLDWTLVPPGFYGRVLRATAKLPFGATKTYAEVAGEAGNARAYRAAGTALGTNPIPLVVPCHRVLRSGGVLGNYGGGPEMKRFLLEHEGVIRGD